MQLLLMALVGRAGLHPSDYGGLLPAAFLLFKVGAVQGLAAELLGFHHLFQKRPLTSLKPGG